MNANIWKEEEIVFLCENYPSHGLLFCVEKLQKNKKTVKRKIDLLKLKRDENFRYSKEYFSKIVANAKSLADVTRQLNLKSTCGNRNTVKKYINYYQINISHFDGGKSNLRTTSRKYKTSEILIQNSTYLHTTNLKDRLYAEKLKERKCEKCGQGEMWNGEHMSLILDHINGVNNDNRLENLRILCPNCNATLPTHGGKNIKVL